MLHGYRLGAARRAAGWSSGLVEGVDDIGKFAMDLVAGEQAADGADLLSRANGDIGPAVQIDQVIAGPGEERAGCRILVDDKAENGEVGHVVGGKGLPAEISCPAGAVVADQCQFDHRGAPGLRVFLPDAGFTLAALFSKRPGRPVWNLQRKASRVAEIAGTLFTSFLISAYNPHDKS